MTSLMCLAMAVYFETRGEMKYNVDAGVAVAEVVMNRVESDRYPDTVCGVVTEDRGPRAYDCQFSFWCDGKSDKMTDEDSELIARLVAYTVLEGHTLFDLKAMHYHSENITTRWSDRMEIEAVVGRHNFYVEK